MLSESSQTVIGIDPSLSGTGVIVLDRSGAIVSKAVASAPSEGTKVRQRMQRFARIINAVMAEVRLHKPAIVCIEGYSLGSNMPGVSDRVEFGGLLRWSLIAANCVVHEVGPLTLKKWATGKGAGDKTAVIAHITKRYGHVFRSDNEYDAFALARIALQIAGLEQPATEPQREAIDTVVNGSAKKQRKARAAMGRP